MKKIVAFLFLFVISVFAEPIEPSKNEKCYICGMDVNIDKKQTSQIKLKNGKHIFFEQASHGILYYLNNQNNVKEFWVKDYSSGKWIDGTKAYYVITDKGIMGYGVLAFQSKINASKFAKGKRVYEFKEIDKEFLQNLEKGHIH